MLKEFDLDGVVPWGRRYDEYEAFFALGSVRPGLSILDAGGGPASFAAEAAERGFSVTAADPLYQFDGAAIRRRFEETAVAMRQGMRVAAYRFKWDFYGSEEAVHRRRYDALELFLADFEKERRRYVPASLPKLPFGKGEFDLALSSHFLFLYGDELDCAFHLAAIRELMRVAGEARIFPLVNLDGRPSSHLRVVMRELEQLGFLPELVPVPFEFQIGATQMLQVRRA
jgi:SAM-dependent methyltransferase